MEHFAGSEQRVVSKVLVAEESARLRRIVRLNLGREGFEAIEADSLAECQARIRDGDVGLVIVSSQFPGFEAYAFSQWLRSEFPERAMPVVILSFEPEDRLLTLLLRLAAFRQKPFDPGELVSQVADLLQPV